MAKLVKRYKPLGIDYWEIFNEPNLPGYGWPFKFDDQNLAISTYSSALETANNTIRRYDPQAVIISAALSPDGIKPDFFLNTLYKNIGKNCFDVFAFHPYGQLSYLGKVREAIKKIMNENSDNSKPIWFNEFGTDNDSERAFLLAQLPTQLKYSDGFFWFTLRDISESGNNFGLLEYNWQKKPVTSI